LSSESRVFNGCRAEEIEMFGCSSEPTLSDALSDPIVQTIMHADHVDPHALEATLRATARKVQGRLFLPAGETRPD
jgi:hypothetical protein